MWIYKHGKFNFSLFLFFIRFVHVTLLSLLCYHKYQTPLDYLFPSFHASKERRSASQQVVFLSFAFLTESTLRIYDQVNFRGYCSLKEYKSLFPKFWHVSAKFDLIRWSKLLIESTQVCFSSIISMSSLLIFLGRSNGFFVYHFICLYFCFGSRK